MIAAFLCVIAVVSMLMGRLSDRMRRTRLIGFGFLLASAGLWAGSLMLLLALIIVSLMIAGIGVSTYHPAAYAAIYDAGHGQGRAYSAFESAGSIAIMAMLVMHGLLASRIGWRGVLAVVAIPGALMGFVLLLVLMGFASSACLPAQSMILTALSSARSKGQVFGALIGATTLTASASPLLFGLLADRAGLAAAVLACSVPVAAGFVVVVFVWRLIALPS